MNWIRTKSGGKAHVVLKDHSKTICGISVRHAIAIVTPGVEDRCENCDHEWRGGKRRPKEKKKESVYVNRFRFHDE